MIGVAAGPALAIPSNCSTGTWYSQPQGATVKCYNGTGQYRAKVYCLNDYNKGTWRYGPWISVGGGWSDAYCNSTYPYLTSSGYDRR
ncbi:hypothetical protein ACN26Y_13240 [Micromonospora sp. WMMD558]|uniref:hypothetical protein n=1 Tax=unclassified Micromonospora TaxID=2617518 RepID=UPI0012B4F3FA|nr:hypothetical protein [Micromonospora sp. WMMC415]QGN47168.1 hypothetical protein GKC29_10105 [Micromonospora sp. WMMC415]